MPTVLSDITTNIYTLSHKLNITLMDLLPLCREGSILELSSEYENCTPLNIEDLTVKQILILLMLNSLQSIIPIGLSKECIPEYTDEKESKIASWHKLQIKSESGIELFVDAAFEPMYGWILHIDVKRELNSISELLQKESSTLIYHYYDATAYPDETKYRKALIKKDQLTKFQVRKI